MFICEYCKSELSTITSLKYHQKNTKKCLSIRGLSSSKKCEFCDKTFSTNQKLNQHSEICPEKKTRDAEYNTKQILYLTERNKELQINSEKNIKISEELREKDEEIEKMRLSYKKELEEKERKIERLIEEIKSNQIETIQRMDKNQMETIQLAISKGKGNMNNNGVINIQNINTIITEPLSNLCNDENIQRQVDAKLTKEYMVKQGELEYAYGDFFTDHIVRGKNGEIQATSDGKNFKYMVGDEINLDKGGDTLKSMVKKTCFISSMNEKMGEIWESIPQEEKEDGVHPNKPPQLKGVGWKFMEKVRDRTSMGTKDANNIKRSINFVPTSNENCIQEIKEGKKKEEKRKKDNKKYETKMKEHKRSLDEDEETISDMIKRKKEEREKMNEGKILKWVLFSEENGEIEKMVKFNDHKEILDEQIQLNEKYTSYKFDEIIPTERERKGDKILVSISRKIGRETEEQRFKFYVKRLIMMKEIV